MSYVNQDVVGDDIPFAGPNVVAKTRQFWIVESARFAKAPTQGPCGVCGDVKGTCDDCLEYTKLSAVEGKVNIGSGEDANYFR